MAKDPDDTRTKDLGEDWPEREELDLQKFMIWLSLPTDERPPYWEWRYQGVNEHEESSDSDGSGPAD